MLVEMLEWPDYAISVLAFASLFEGYIYSNGALPPEHSGYDNTTELWLYSDGKNQKITADAVVSHCTVSPNGKAISFSTYEDEHYQWVIWDGKTFELGKDKIPIALSDGAKYIYYVNRKNNALYV